MGHFKGCVPKASANIDTIFHSAKFSSKKPLFNIHFLQKSGQKSLQNMFFSINSHLEHSVTFMFKQVISLVYFLQRETMRYEWRSIDFACFYQL